MLILFVGMWVTLCAMTGAAIFHAKNRPAWEGALLVLLLGVFGILLAACISYREQS